MGAIRDLAESFWRGEVDPATHWMPTGQREEIAPGLTFLHAFANISVLRTAADDLRRRARAAGARRHRVLARAPRRRDRAAHERRRDARRDRRRGAAARRSRGPAVASHLVDWAAPAEPASREVHAVRAEIYAARASASRALMTRGIYSAAARESAARAQS